MEATRCIEILQAEPLVSIELPWPPSVNNYWSRSRAGVFLTARAKQFRVNVLERFLEHRVNRKSSFRYPLTAPLWAKIALHPPNRQARDTDNHEKALWDSLQHAGMFHDDRQLCVCLRHWAAPKRRGGITLELGVITEPSDMLTLPHWAHTEETEDGTPRPTKAKRRRTSPKSRVRLRRK